MISGVCPGVSVYLGSEIGKVCLLHLPGSRSPCFGIFSLDLIWLGLGFAQLYACFCHWAEEALLKVSGDYLCKLAIVWEKLEKIDYEPFPHLFCSYSKSEIAFVHFSVAY